MVKEAGNELGEAEWVFITKFRDQGFRHWFGTAQTNWRWKQNEGPKGKSPILSLPSPEYPAGLCSLENNAKRTRA